MTMKTKQHGAEYWDKHAKNYDRSMMLLGRPIPKMAALAADAVRSASRVLEVAAGTGLVTVSIARSAKSVIATDYAAAMVEMLEQRMRALDISNVRCQRADIYALSFEAQSFDAVVAANVLHLLPDLPAALKNLRRLIRHGGVLIAPTYCHDETWLSWLTSRALAVSGFPGHRRFTAKSLRATLESEGLHVTRSDILPGVIPIAYIEGSFSDPAPATLAEVDRPTNK